MADDELMTLGEAAELAGVHRSTVVQWVNTGRLETVTLPERYRRKGRWRYVKRTDVEKIMQQYEGRQRLPRQTREGGTDGNEV